MKTKIAEIIFTVPAPQSRVWDLLGPALLNSPLGLEKIEVLDENHVRAEARMKFVFLTLPMKILVIFEELVAPERMGVELQVRALGGLIRLDQKIQFTLHPLNENKTEIRCESFAEEGTPVFFPFLIWMARSKSETTFGGIEETLKRLA